MLALCPGSFRVDLSQEVGLDLLLVCASYVGAHLLRFGGAAPTLTQAVTVLPAIGLLKGAVFSQCQLYRTVWTYAGTPDAVRLVCGSTGASIGLLLGATVLPAGTAPDCPSGHRLAAYDGRGGRMAVRRSRFQPAP